MDAAKARAAPAVQSPVFEYNVKDLILYALSVGANTVDDLRYVYENDEHFGAFPTFIVRPGLMANSAILDWPGVQFDLTRAVHGEHFIEFYIPLRTEGKLRSEVRVVDVVDKGSGAFVICEVTTFDAESGDKVAMQQIGLFMLGLGGFGGSRTSTVQIPTVAVPRRPPDVVVEQKTDVSQAALYRLASGDMNPLHIDAQFARMSGFDTPILHGLCFLGFSVRHIIKTFANNDASYFKTVKARFSSPVLPGQTLRIEMWREGCRIHFQTKVKESGKIAIANAYVDLKTVKRSSPTTDSGRSKI